MAISSFSTSRRSLLLTGGAAAVLAACSKRGSPPKRADASASDPEVAKWRAITDAEWRERLDPLAYAILREEGTERPFTSPLNDEKRDGIFACAACALPLFTSETKYDSRTGWPSFYDAIPGALGTKIDNKLWVPRTEYHCSRCLSHNGHVFPDGPRPTGLRYCSNGIALQFIPAEA